MNPIMQALGAGYSASHILRYLSQHNPKLAQKITAALNVGHSVDHVLNYISKHQKSIGKLIPESAELKQSENLYKTAQSQVHPSLTNAAKLAGTAALAAGGAYALSRSAPRILQYIQASGGQTAAQGLGSQPPNPSAQAPSQAAGIPQQSPNNMQAPQGTSQPPVSPGSIAQGVQPLQAQGKTVNPAEMLNKHGLLKHVEELAKTQKDPKAIAALLYSKFPKEMKEFQKESGKNMEDAIEDYLGTQPISQVNQQAPVESQNKLTPDVNIKNIIPTKVGDKFINRHGEEAIITQINDKTFEYETSKRKRSGPISDLPEEIAKTGSKLPSETTKTEPEQPRQISKNEAVATPHGVGEIKSDIRNGQAIVEVNGKKYKISEDQLHPEPRGIRNTRIVMDVAKVPEKAKSAMLSYVFVPKSKNDIILRMGTGKKAYRYWRKDGQPIDEAQIEKLREGSTVPITDGDEFLGSWDPKEADSRGSSASREIVQNATEWTPEKQVRFEREGLSKGTSFTPEVPMHKESDYWSEEVDIPFMHGYWDQFENEIDISKEMFDREKARRLLSEGKRKRERKPKEIERRFT